MVPSMTSGSTLPAQLHLLLIVARWVARVRTRYPLKIAFGPCSAGQGVATVRSGQSVGSDGRKGRWLL